MSKITGKEPHHWHTPDGKHNMKDPRKIPGWIHAYWDDDEKAYVKHLESHEDSAPRDNDSDQIKGLHAEIEHCEKTISLCKEMIVTLRQANER